MEQWTDLFPSFLLYHAPSLLDSPVHLLVLFLCPLIMSLNKTSHKLNLCNLCGQSFHSNFIHKHLQTCTGASTFVPRNHFFSHPVDRPPALAPACLTAISGALCTSSASSVNNKEPQSEHEPTMTVGKQTESHPINSSSTIANIVDKPGHNEAFYDDDFDDTAGADAMIDDDEDDDADIGDGPLAMGDHQTLGHFPSNPPNDDDQSLFSSSNGTNEYVDSNDCNHLFHSDVINLPPLTLQPTEDDVDFGDLNDYDDAHSQMTALKDGCANTEYINNNGGDEHVTVSGQDEQAKVPAIDIEVDHQTAQTYGAPC
jgi:hypothetical protein